MLRQYFNCNEILEIFLKCFCNILCYVGSVPRANTEITGISKLKGRPILKVQYLDSKSMKLKNSNGGLKSMISTFKSQIGSLE